MSDNIHIKLPDGSDKEMPKGSTALDVAKSISPRLAEAAIAAKVSSNRAPAGEGDRRTQAGLRQELIDLKRP